MSTFKLLPGTIAPALSFPLLSGETFTLSNHSNKPKQHFTIVIFYRGAFCPICMNYIKEIEEQYDRAMESGYEIILVSMDTKEKAEQSMKDIAKKVPIGYGLPIEMATDWGLYISNGRINTSEAEYFCEPGLFVLRPSEDNTTIIYMTSIQSAPFTRPNINELIDGLNYVVQHQYPIRGTRSTVVEEENQSKA